MALDKNPLKIAFLNYSHGAVDRGAELFVTELSSRLKKKHNVTIYSENKTPPERSNLLWRFYIDKHALVICKFTLKNLLNILREKHDVVIPVDGGWQPALVRLATWLYGGKMVISGQSGFGWDDRNNLWAFPNRFVTLSTKGIKWSRKTNPFVKVVCIPNGVDLNIFKAPKSKPVKKLILIVAALNKSKRIDLAIKAVKNLDYELVVVGKGPEKKRLKELGKKLLGNRFKLISAPHSNMPNIYQKASVFTLPSYQSEAFGVVYLEAMASGLPVVATDDAQRREIVGTAGFFVDPEDTEAYTKALKKALETDWGDKPRKQAEKFSWDKIALEYDKLFYELTK